MCFLAEHVGADCYFAVQSHTCRLRPCRIHLWMRVSLGGENISLLLHTATANLQSTVVRTNQCSKLQGLLGLLARLAFTTDSRGM